MMARALLSLYQLWEMDIEYGYIEGEQRFFYMLSLIDVMDRSIIDYHIGTSCLATDAIAVLKGVLMKRQLFESPTMPVIRTDNSPQFIAFNFEVACQEQVLTTVKVRMVKSNARGLLPVNSSVASLRPRQYI
jgi:putative transposase